MTPDPYAPKRRVNPADNIADLHPKPLSWLRRNVPDETLRDLPSAAFETPAPPIEYERAPDPQPPPPAIEEPTDKQYVALGIDRLRHLDLKTMVAEMFGDELPKDRSEIADKMAQWAASNNPRVAA